MKGENSVSTETAQPLTQQRTISCCSRAQISQRTQLQKEPDTKGRDCTTPAVWVSNQAAVGSAGAVGRMVTPGVRS